MSNVLIIGDLHEPFCLKEYLPFCKKVYKEEKCNRVVFIGDVIDSHYSSYHETDPDGMSAGDELTSAIKRLRKWYRAFPLAHVMLGNHDLIVHRKAFSAGVSSRWIREFSDVLQTPLWNFVESKKIDGITYCHGTGKKARARAKDNMLSICQGHYHTDAYAEWLTGENFKVLAMQVGCGIDRRSYAMAYGKHFPHPAIGCGVIKNGKVATTHMMDL